MKMSDDEFSGSEGSFLSLKSIRNCFWPMNSLERGELRRRICSKWRKSHLFTVACTVLLKVNNCPRRHARTIISGER